MLTDVVSNGEIEDEVRRGWSIKCPNCDGIIRYTTLNITGGREPYFYSDKTSDFLLRDEDADFIAKTIREDEASIEDWRNAFQEIEQAIGLCPTGGRFTFWANVKCPQCWFEFPYNHGFKLDEMRIFESKIVWIEGATLFKGGTKPSFRLVHVDCD